MEIRFKDWNIEAMTGYKPQTTIYMDLSIAERLGVSAIKDTVRRVRRDWSGNVIYMTELVMALNWKIWEHHGRHALYEKIYNDMYFALRDWCLEHFTGEDLTYFYETTD